MKKILIALIFGFTVVANPIGIQNLFLNPRPSTTQDITVDLHETFEFTPPTKANFEANDAPFAGAWTTNDTADLLVTTSTTGERATISTFNGVADTGTRSMARGYEATGAAWPEFNIGSDKTDASFGFWFRYTGDPAVNKRLFWVINGGGSDVVIIDYQRVTDTLTFINGANSNGVALSADTHYWVTVDVTQNATSTARVYDTSSAQVGTDFTVTAGNNAIRRVLLGNYNAQLVDTGIVVYFDDFVADWTDATFPLGP